MNSIDKLVSFIHKNFLLALILAYLLAIIAPEFGNYLRSISLGNININGDTLGLSMPLLMLSLLLMNAGLGIKVQELKGITRNPLLLLTSILANSLVPIVAIFLVRAVLGMWHNPDELENLLTGLALIVAMPIAGSSAAWSQNANGNLSLSLGLVLTSTLSSPIATPLILRLFSYLTTGDYSEDLQELAVDKTNLFMFAAIVLPSLLGIATHFCLGDKRIAKIKSLLKLINFSLLLLLNYSNASTSLPAAFAKPDWDFLLFILFVVSTMCCISFSTGWLISKLFKANKSDTASLMFGLGMNNNGTGLVFATATLSDHPAVLLPIVFYTLIQQIVAAAVDKRFFQNGESSQTEYQMPQKEQLLK